MRCSRLTSLSFAFGDSVWHHFYLPGRSAAFGFYESNYLEKVFLFLMSCTSIAGIFPQLFCFAARHLWNYWDWMDLEKIFKNSCATSLIQSTKFHPNYFLCFKSGSCVIFWSIFSNPIQNQSGLVELWRARIDCIFIFNARKNLNVDTTTTARRKY